MKTTLKKRLERAAKEAELIAARRRANKRRLLEHAVEQFITEARAVGEEVTRAGAIKYLTTEIPEIVQLAD